MKVGFVVDDHMGRPGGVQEYVRGLRRYLEAHGHSTVVFSGSGGVPERGVIPVGVSLPLRGSGSSTSVPLTPASPARLRSLLDREACDLLHVMAPYSPTLSGRLLVHSTAAHVMTFLVAIEPPRYLRLLALAARLQWRSLGRFQARIAISRAAAASAAVLYGGDYRLVPAGIDVERFAPVPFPAARDDEHPTVLYVGRLEQRKGVAHLLRAAARLQRQLPGLRLEIGGDGPEHQSLQALASDLALTSVTFHGYVPAAELPDLLRRADIFCAPATHAESFGIVLLEAMAAGLPIVAAANAGYAEVLDAHPGNLLVPPGDERALAGALAAFAQSRPYRHAIGGRNLAAARQYSWDNVGAAIEEVYATALDARAGIKTATVGH